MKIVSKIFRIAAITFCLMVIVLAGIRQFMCFMLGYGGGIATVFGFIFSSNVRNHTYSYIAILDSGKEEIVSSGLRSTDYVSFAVLPGFPALLYALIYFVLNHILPLVVVFICIFAIVHLCFKKPKPTLLRLECLFAVLLLILSFYTISLVGVIAGLLFIIGDLIGLKNAAKEEKIITIAK